MKINIETRLTRPGETSKRSLNSQYIDCVVDFDEFGHEAPSTEAWKAFCRSLMLSPNQALSIAEAGGTFCGPRLAWMLIRSGFKHVSLITPSKLVTSKSTGEPFDESELDTVEVSGFVSIDTVISAMDSETQIIDVRSASRFSGEEADPRPLVRAGHIPTSINIHYGEFLSSSDESVFKPTAELNNLFNHHGIDLNKPIIFSCGSGITACIGALCAMQCGADSVDVFDGSWAEWGARQDLPVALGNAS